MTSISAPKCSGVLALLTCTATLVSCQFAFGDFHVEHTAQGGSSAWDQSSGGALLGSTDAARRQTRALMPKSGIVNRTGVPRQRVARTTRGVLGNAAATAELDAPGAIFACVVRLRSPSGLDWCF